MTWLLVILIVLGVIIAAAAINAHYGAKNTLVAAVEAEVNLLKGTAVRDLQNWNAVAKADLQKVAADLKADLKKL